MMPTAIDKFTPDLKPQPSTSSNIDKDLNAFWVRMFPKNPTKPSYVHAHFLAMYGKVHDRSPLLYKSYYYYKLHRINAG